MGCGSGYLFSGNYYWSQVGLDWWSVEHRRESLMLCGYSASPEEEKRFITIYYIRTLDLCEYMKPE